MSSRRDHHEPHKGEMHWCSFCSSIILTKWSSSCSSCNRGGEGGGEDKELSGWGHGSDVEWRKAYMTAWWWSSGWGPQIIPELYEDASSHIWWVCRQADGPYIMHVADAILMPSYRRACADRAYLRANNLWYMRDPLVIYMRFIRSLRRSYAFHSWFLVFLPWF